MKSLPKNKNMWLYVVAVALVLLSVVLGTVLGAAKLSLSEVLNAIANGNIKSPDARILIYVRLPRTLAGLFCGAALSVSGAVIQCVLANRLASPSIIGVNSGAGLAVILCSAFGIVGGWGISLSAFAGAFAAVLLVTLVAKKWGASRGTVILMGVALNALLGAISDTVLAFVPEVGMMSNEFRIGEFSSVTFARLMPAAAVIVISILLLLTLSNELDVLTLGDENAKGLGLNTGAVRVIFLLLSAFLAGAAVSVAGLLSFVGLLVPHSVRRIATSHPKHLLPLCALFGASFVSLCDTLARVVFAPYELPVGVIMSFIGAPFFILILIKKKGGHGNA